MGLSKYYYVRKYISSENSIILIERKQNGKPSPFAGRGSCGETL
jgi:hypothetical protein